jgi:hypothetical protein
VGERGVEVVARDSRAAAERAEYAERLAAELDAVRTFG